MDAWELYQSFFDPKLGGQYAVRDLQQNLGTPGLDEKIQVKPFEPEEEKTLMDSIGGHLMGGAAAAGAALEKPGRAIRGLLAGKLREGLSFIPFSDTLRITDYKDRVSGRDLGRQWGWMDSTDNWGNFAGGLGIEMALDPLTFVTGIGPWAYGAGGQAAKALGLKPATYSAGLRNNLGQLMSEYSGKIGYGDIAERLGEYATKVGKSTAELSNAPVNHFVQFGLPFGIGGDAYRFGVGGSGLYDAISKGAGLVGSGVHAFNEGVKSVPYIGPIIGGFNPVSWAETIANQIPKVGRLGKGLFSAQYKEALGAPVQSSAAAMSRFIPGQQMAARNLATALGETVQDTLGKIDDVSNLFDPTITHTGGMVPQGYTLAQYYGMADSSGNVLPEFLPWFREKAYANLVENPTESLTKFNASNMSGQLQGGTSFDDLVETIYNNLTATSKPGSKEEIINTIRKAIGGADPSSTDILQVAAGVQRKAQEVLLKQNTDLGVQIPTWSNSLFPNLKYSHREVTLGEDGMKGLGAAASEFSGRSPFKANDIVITGKRSDPFELFKQGRTGIDFARNDADIMKNLSVNDAAKQLLNRYSDPTFLANPEMVTLAEEAVGNLRSLAKLGPDQRSIYGNSSIVDAMNYGLIAGRVNNAAQTVADVALQNQLNPLSVPKGMETVPIEDVLRPANMDPGAIAGLNRGSVIDKKIADDLGKVMRSVTPTGPQGVLRDLYDQGSSMWKTLNTNLWPSFHTRNFFGGQVVNLLGEGGLGSLLSIPAARRIYSGKGLSDAEREFAREAFAGNAVSALNQGNELRAGFMGQAGTTTEQLLNQIPGNSSLTLLGDVIPAYAQKGQASTSSWNPIPFFKNYKNRAATDTWTPVVAGEMAGNLTEGMNRMPQYIALRNKGYSPLGAAQEVIASHYDYSPSAFTSFERDWMKRLMPFYSWTKYNLPRQAQNVFLAPGSPSGQFVRGALNLRMDNNEFLPEYLGSGLSIPIGVQDAKGMQRYLTKLDTPVEQAFEVLKPGNLMSGKGAMGILGMLNPFIKAPLETITGKQFFTGRDLQDLYSPTGYVAAENVVANALGRLASTARQALDPRKWNPDLFPGVATFPINFLTGIRFSDVDIPKYKDITAREYIKDKMRGRNDIRFHETMSPDREALYRMLYDPSRQEDLMLMRLQKGVEKRARERAKEKKNNPEQIPIAIR